MGPREIVVMVAMCSVWGFHFVVIKLAVSEIPPIFYAAIRMTLVAVLMSAFLRWRPGQMRRVMLTGLCMGALNYAFMFSGLKYGTASSSAIALELYVPFATILSVVFLGEKVGWRRVSGITLAFVGVAVIALGMKSDDPGTHILLGVALVAGAAAIEAVGTINIKKVTGFKPHELLAWFSLIGAVVLWPLSFLLESGQSAALAASDKMLMLGAILYSAIGGSVLGHTAYYWLLQRLPVSQVAPSTLLITVVAVISGVLVLGDPLGLPLIIGGFMTLVGVGVVMARTPHDKVIEPASVDT